MRSTRRRSVRLWRTLRREASTGGAEGGALGFSSAAPSTPPIAASVSRGGRGSGGASAAAAAGAAEGNEVAGGRRPRRATGACSRLARLGSGGTAGVLESTSLKRSASFEKKKADASAVLAIASGSAVAPVGLSERLLRRITGAGTAPFGLTGGEPPSDEA